MKNMPPQRRADALPLSVASRKPSGVVEFKFPRRRVVVAVPDADAVIEAFCNAGCQVAFCGTDIDGGQAYAEAVGAQFNPVNEFCAETLCRAMSRVMKAWRDIEIVICTADMAQAIISHWRTLRSALPMEPDYGRVVVIGSNTAEIPAIPNATVNAIVCRDIDNAVASACLFFALPECGAVSGQIISTL